MNKLEKLSQAVTLTHFEVSNNPDLIYSQILANLMSESVWELNKKIIPQEGYSPKTIANKIHQYIHDWIYQIGEKDAIERWGFEDIQKEKERFGDIKKIIYWVKKGNLLVDDKDALDLINSGIKKGIFMKYKNQIYDLMLASRFVREDKKGEGNCADLAILSASLAIINGFDTAIIGSPFHYMTFAVKGNKSFIFSNKDLFDYKKIRKPEFKNKIEYFTSRLILDRLITKEGVYSSKENKSTIAKENFKEWKEQINDFFGFKIPQIEGNRIYSDGFPELSFNNRNNICKQIFSQQFPIFEYAQYCYRSPQINPFPYIIAANRNPSFRKIDIKCIDKLKNEKILSEGRIILPEEIFRFKKNFHLSYNLKEVNKQRENIKERLRNLSNKLE